MHLHYNTPETKPVFWSKTKKLNIPIENSCCRDKQCKWAWSAWFGKSTPQTRQSTNKPPINNYTCLIKIRLPGNGADTAVEMRCTGHSLDTECVGLQITAKQFVLGKN